MVLARPEAIPWRTMSRRIDIELTSALADNVWTWRAAGAKQPKGTLDGSILFPGAAVGDVFKVEVEQEIDGITVLSVVGGRQKEERADVLELLPSEREFKPVIETPAKRDRNERGGRGDRGERGERRPRRDRDDRAGRGDGRGAGRGDGRGDGRAVGRGDGGPARTGGRSDGGRSDGGRGRRGPSFTPPPEVPQRPKPKRLKAGKGNRNAVLADLPDEQRGVAELALQGMAAVRERLREENRKAADEGRSPMPEATVLKLAEDLLPKLRVAEWRDRAEAALRQMEHLDLRDLRSVVAAAGDPVIARDETASALAAELTAALAAKQEQELRLWFGDVDAALAVGRVIRALRLSSMPPKAGVPFPSDIAQRLIDSANASLAPMDTPERWIATLEAAAFAPIHASIAPVRKPDVVNDELLATVKRLAPALPLVAALFEIEVDPKTPMPRPLRPGPRSQTGGSKGGSERTAQRPPRDRKPSAGKSGSSKPKPIPAPPERTRPPADASAESPVETTAADAAPESPVETTAADAAPESPVETAPARDAAATDDAITSVSVDDPEASAVDEASPVTEATPEPTVETSTDEDAPATTDAPTAAPVTVATSEPPVGTPPAEDPAPPVAEAPSEPSPAEDAAAPVTEAPAEASALDEPSPVTEAPPEPTVETSADVDEPSDTAEEVAALRPEGS
jgi:hypothetical protein